MRIQVQVHVLHSYFIHYGLDLSYSKPQELNIDKSLIHSNSSQKLLPLIKTASGDNVEFKELKNSLIDAIQIGLDKMGSRNVQNTDGDKNNIIATIAALDYAKISLEQFQT